jgi:hypothetical protein
MVCFVRFVRRSRSTFRKKDGLKPTRFETVEARCVAGDPTGQEGSQGARRDSIFRRGSRSIYHRKPPVSYVDICT